MPAISILKTNNGKNLWTSFSIMLQKGLGIEDQKIGATLYKLLIYEKNGFFLPHIDSEKEKGMFGTLIIGLPSKHKGGEITGSL